MKRYTIREGGETGSWSVVREDGAWTEFLSRDEAESAASAPSAGKMLESDFNWQF